MRGRGIGSMFGRLFRSSIPYLKKLGGYAGKQLLETGVDTLQDMSSGLGVKAALRKNTYAGRNRVFNDLKSKMTGNGKRRKRRRVKKTCKPSKKNKKNKDPF